MPPTTPLASGDRNIGRLIGGRYRVVAAIGKGGMGAVYRAVHTEIGKDVAVKLLRPELSATEEAVRRFEREAEALSRLLHPNCVRVTDFGRAEDGGMFLAMEYLAGRPLTELLAATPALPPARAVHIAAQLLDAIAHAHGLGVVHRDLKPENVMLVPMDGDPDGVKILDFGIARLFSGEGGERITEPAAVFGTPEYLSPEQALGEAADGRADLYAIGVILYEMLAGRRPFAGATRGELLAAHLTREPPPLRSVAPAAGISPQLEAVVHRALAKRRDERWATAEELLAALLHAQPTDAAYQAAGNSSSEGSGGAAASPAPGAGSPPAENPATIPLPAAVAAAPIATAHRRWVLLGAAGVAALVLLALLVAALTGGSPDGDRGRSGARRVAVRSAADAELEAVRAALARGDAAEARRLAERLAHEHPDDARAFLLLGHVMFAHRDRVRGLAAYREAARLDRAVAAGEAELLANLRASFDDKVHGEPAFALAEQLGPPAGRVLRDYAATVRDPRLRQRALRAAAKAGDADPRAP